MASVGCVRLGYVCDRTTINAIVVGLCCLRRPGAGHRRVGRRLVTSQGPVSQDLRSFVPFLVANNNYLNTVVFT